MAPKTPPEVKWDYQSLADAAGVIRHIVKDVQFYVEDEMIYWRDPTVHQTSSGGSPLKFAPVAPPQEWEEYVTREVGDAIHNGLMPLVAKALSNLALQADYAAAGLVHMANSQEGAEDAAIVTIFDTMDKAFDHPRRSS
jgi:hypothetical protein